MPWLVPRACPVPLYLIVWAPLAVLLLVWACMVGCAVEILVYVSKFISSAQLKCQKHDSARSCVP
jgi:hypothetical protein